MSKREGFTLLELLVVVAIIAIIAVIAIPNYMGAVDKAKDARDLAEINAVEKAVALYYAENGHYPTSSVPVEGSPQSIDLSALIPEYLDRHPNYANWVVDYQGKVTHGLGGSTLTLTSGDPATMLTEAQWAIFDWSKVQPPAGQVSGNIGVDSWGNPVNMDLWASHKIIASDYSAAQGYTPVGTIALSEFDGSPSGYKGTFINGKIEGFVPARVKLAGEPAFSAVTSVDSTFYDNSGLVTAPILPNSVRSMNMTYQQCSNLTNVPVLPTSLLSMEDTFNSCTSLTTSPVIPFGVVNMVYTYQYCTNLTSAPVLPSSVVRALTIFDGCTKLGY